MSIIDGNSIEFEYLNKNIRIEIDKIFADDDEVKNINLSDLLSILTAQYGTPKMCSTLGNEFSHYAKDYENWNAMGNNRIVPIEALKNEEFADKIRYRIFSSYINSNDIDQKCAEILLKFAKLDNESYTIENKFGWEIIVDYKVTIIKHDYMFEFKNIRDAHLAILVIENQNIDDDFKDLNFPYHLINSAKIWDKFKPDHKINVPLASFDDENFCRHIIGHEFNPIKPSPIHNQKCLELLFKSGVELSDDFKMTEEIAKILIKCRKNVNICHKHELFLKFGYKIEGDKLKCPDTKWYNFW